MTLILRILAGMIDLGITGGMAAGLFYMVLHVSRLELPPRYWNYWDYLVDIINLHPVFVYIALSAIVLSVLIYAFAGMFVRGSVGLLVTGLEVYPGARGIKTYMRLVIRFLLFLVGMTLAGLPLYGIIWSDGRRGLHDWIAGVEVRRRGSSGRDIAREAV